MKILNCNVGSTSLKFKLYDMPQGELLSEGKVERVGSKTDAIYSFFNQLSGYKLTEEKQSIPDYTAGINRHLADLTGSHGVLKNNQEIAAVVFKCPIAAGFSDTHPVSEELFRGMEEYVNICGTHNTPTIKAIRLFMGILPDVPMVCAFETGFHQNIPMERRIWGIPYEWYEKYGVCRRGYHGASHNFISDEIAAVAKGPYRLISCHLGGSSSVCAIRDGKSQDVSWGFSLQSGLPHAYRAGDTDSSLVTYLLSRGLTMDEINEGLTHSGGLLGISGVSDDMRYIEDAAGKGNERAVLAIDVFCENIIRYIGGFYAEMGGMEYLTFTGGIGEKSPLVREKVASRLNCFGAKLDPERNALGKKAEGGLISAGDSKVKIYVIETNEELNVARRAYQLLA
jgi:acetate kinase